jgi:DNA-binding NarL/FixJ family response regulator
VRTIMFSGYVHSDYIERAIESGAWGYVSKNEGIDDLLSAIQQVAKGEFALSREAVSPFSKPTA